MALAKNLENAASIGKKEMHETIDTLKQVTNLVWIIMETLKVINEYYRTNKPFGYECLYRSGTCW